MSAFFTVVIPCAARLSTVFTVICLYFKQIVSVFFTLPGKPCYTRFSRLYHDDDINKGFESVGFVYTGMILVFHRYHVTY